MFRWVTGFLPVALLLMTVSAGAFAPQLASVAPAGMQRGNEVEFIFKGERLQDAEEVIFYEPGVEVLKLTAVSNLLVKAQVKIAADCGLGEHHLRLRTATGVSELRTFMVGTMAIIEEVEPNDKPSQAQRVALNSTIAGFIKSEDMDCYAVALKAGELFSAEVEGIRLGRANFDPRLTVLDEREAIVADADDTYLAMQDPFLSFVAPSNGPYLLAVRDVTYGGSENCQYLLHVGNFARPTAVFPMGGKAGETQRFSFFSTATGWFTNEIKLPNATQDRFGIYGELAGLASPTPNWVRVADFPNVLSSAGNRDRQHATVTELQPPMALNGILAEKGQEDWFRFAANKGTAVEVKVLARRLRSPVDSVVEIFDANGQSVASDDDAAGADSFVKFTPSATTNYFLRIRDTLGHGGPEFVYRVELDVARPSIGIKIPEVARNDTQSRQYIAVPRGNRFATLISAKRANLDSELTMSMEGLPKGVTMLVEPLAAKVDSFPLVFEAAADAPIAGKLLDLTATGTNAQGKVSGNFRQTVELVQGPPNNVNYYSATVDKLFVGVTKEAPFKLRIVEPKVPLVRGGAMRLEVIAEREKGFDEPIEMKMVWNPPGVSSQSEATIPKGATNVFYQLNASGGAELRPWKIALLGHALVEGGQVYVSTQPAKVEVGAPFLTGKIETLWLSPGKSGKLTVNLQSEKPFDGKATIRLMGLPDKVTAPEIEIDKNAHEAVFDIKVDEKCPTGSHKNLFCAVEVKKDGEVIPHTIASGGILRIVPAKKDVAKVAAVAVKRK